MKYLFASIILATCLMSCMQNTTQNSKVMVAGAIKNVMHKGDLSSHAQLDTLPKEGLYALGPNNELQGELFVANGTVYVSKTTTDSTQMEVTTNPKASAPFLVYANITDWETSALPIEVKTLAELEFYLNAKYEQIKEPFPFQLKGTIDSATVHVQNLAPGSIVKSRADAHKGQVKYPLKKQEVTLLGFYSRAHQGIFTHRNSYMHIHLLTEDHTAMGHLDEVSLGEMDLNLPAKN